MKITDEFNHYLSRPSEPYLEAVYDSGVLMGRRVTIRVRREAATGGLPVDVVDESFDVDLDQLGAFVDACRVR